MSLQDAMLGLPPNEIILANFAKAYSYINRPDYEKIVCTISGGADSDVVLDICVRCDEQKKIEYIYFDTGLEYDATKKHLTDLENKYQIQIKRLRPQKPIPVACKEVGQPFLSKKVAEYIGRLQKYDFKWEDKPFDELYAQYPKCKSALRWWCNAWGEESRFNIEHNASLKEFMVQNPPRFKISAKCCDYAKKSILHECLKVGEYDLNIYGIRKAEGGARSTAVKSCFDNNYGECAEYRPVFWYSDADKREYVEVCGVEHSACYTEYGLRRTGCAGCPFGLRFEEELEVIEKYEPKLFKAVNVIF